MIKLGTRGSRLALAQSGLVADAITAVSGLPVELVVIKTEGDDTSIPLDAPSRPGAFVTALRDALIAGEVDVAVHSFKDLPSAQPEGLVIAAIPQRENPHDLLVSRDGRKLLELDAGARVGTSSPRRAAAVRRCRPDLNLVAVRGNVDTRIEQVRSGRVDAAVLAAAGLARLGRLDAASETISYELMLPAPAQGALAVECAADWGLVERLGALDDEATRRCVTAERAVLSAVCATCTTALGAFANDNGEEMILRAEISDHQGVDYAKTEVRLKLDHGLNLDELVDLGRRAARDLMRDSKKSAVEGARYDV